MLIRSIRRMHFIFFFFFFCNNFITKQRYNKINYLLVAKKYSLLSLKFIGKKVYTFSKRLDFRLAAILVSGILIWDLYDLRKMRKKVQKNTDDILNNIK